jgi:hypothetical protein
MNTPIINGHALAEACSLLQSADKRHNTPSERIVKSFSSPEILNSAPDKSSKAETLKALVSFSGYLRIAGHRVYNDGPFYRTNCSFHDDAAHNLKIIADTHSFCEVCGWRGDIVDFVKRRHQLTELGALSLIEKNAWLAQKSSKGFIWNAKATESVDQVDMWPDEFVAACMVRNGIDAKNGSVSIGIDWPLDVSEELSRLLAGKDVTLHGYSDDMATEHIVDHLSDVCRSVTTKALYDR